MPGRCDLDAAADGRGLSSAARVGRMVSGARFVCHSKLFDKIFAADFLKKLQNSEHSSRQFSLLVFLAGTWYSPDKDIKWIRRGFDEKRS